MELNVSLDTALSYSIMFCAKSKANFYLRKSYTTILHLKIILKTHASTYKPVKE